MYASPHSYMLGASLLAREHDDCELKGMKLTYAPQSHLIVFEGCFEESALNCRSSEMRNAPHVSSMNCDDPSPAPVEISSSRFNVPHGSAELRPPPPTVSTPSPVVKSMAADFTN